MMHLAVSEDDIAKAESLVARVGKDYADSAMFAVAKGDSATVARLLVEARDSANIFLLLNAAWQIGEWLERPASAEPFARAAAARPERQSRANLTLADNLVSQGRWTAADSAYAVAIRTSADGWPRLARALTATLPFLAVPHAELEAIRADLSAWDPARDSPAAATSNAGLLPHVRLYALGLLASRLGEPTAALRAAGQLEAAPAGDEFAPAARPGGRGARGRGHRRPAAGGRGGRPGGGSRRRAARPERHVALQRRLRSPSARRGAPRPR